MKKILIVSALSQELNFIKIEIKKLKIPNLKISYFTTWMGNYNMILNLTRFLEKNNDFDFVINLWICGYKNEKKEFFQVSRILNSSNNKEIIIPNLIDFWSLESIFCSEKIVYDNSILGNQNFVDMESYWFEIVCDNFSIPRIILKIPIDKIWKETREFDFKKAEKYLQKNINYKELLQKIIKYLEKKWKKIDLKKYTEIFDFTFSEKIIFEKLFYKFIALTWENFDKYFNENNMKDKKVFLKDLDNYLKKYIL